MAASMSSRLKGSAESVHPLSGRELRALRRLKRDQDPASPFIFTSERGAPFTTAGFRKMIARLGIAARLRFPGAPAHVATRLRLQTRQ